MSEHVKHLPDWLQARVIFLTKHGSHAYGLNTPASDLDIKGVAVAPASYYHGFLQNFEQAEVRSPVDMVVFDARKFFKLAADCNPNIIEVLCTDVSDHLLVSPIGERLVDIRDHFISKKAKFTFSGYAIAQLKRIQTHYRWMKNPPLKQPERADFGLPQSMVVPKSNIEAAESLIKKKLEAWIPDPAALPDGVREDITSRFKDVLAEVTTATNIHVAAGKSLGFDDNFLHIIEQERMFKVRMTEWHQYNEWKKTRNPCRHVLEEKFGYDTKHAMHLVRLMKMCQEILETGKVNVKRTNDREELLGIRNGAWTYEKLLEWAKSMDLKLNDVYQTSKLPHSPDRVFLNEQLCRIVEEGMV